MVETPKTQDAGPFLMKSSEKVQANGKSRNSSDAAVVLWEPSLSKEGVAL